MHDSLVITLVQHPSFGYMLQPLFASFCPETEVYSITETARADSSTFQTLTEDEQEIVKLAERYSDKNLMRTYSKEDNEVEFLRKVAASTIETYIRPFIEKKQGRLIEIMQATGTPLFSREKTRIRDFRTNQKLEVLREPSTMVFHFRNKETFTYHVEVQNGASSVNLHDRFFAPLVSRPAVAVIGKQLHHFVDIDEKKLRPFFKKKHIEVPPRSVPEYIRGFVVQCMKNYTVKSEGIPVFEQKHRPVAVLRDKYYELIQELENSKERIQTKLREEIIPRKSFIDKFITQNIDGIEYSIIPLEAKYENLINKYPEEIRVIETKELNTIFASDSIKSIPDTSLFSRCVRSRNDLYTFLMDMSVRKLDTLSKEEELNNQLKLISQNKSICMSELEAELIELLNNEVGVNVESIKEYKSEINKILNTLLNYSTRTDILRGRENTCKQYLCNYNMK